MSGHRVPGENGARGVNKEKSRKMGCGIISLRTNASQSESRRGILEGAYILSGVLAGSGASLNLTSGSASHAFAAFRIEAFLPESEYREHMGAMIDGLKESERQPGVDEILIPGELESKLEADRAGRGIIPLHPTLVQGINDACGEFGLDLRLT